METTAKSPTTRISVHNEYADRIKTLYGKSSEANNHVIHNYFEMRDLTLAELKGRFTRPELVGLLKAFQDKNLPNQNKVDPKDRLTSELHENQTFMTDEERNTQGFTEMALLSKLTSLMPYQSFFLLDSIKVFCANPDGKMDDFIAEFSV